LTLVKTGSGKTTFAGPVKHSGTTIVENGILALPYRPAPASTPVSGMARWFDASSPANVTTNTGGKITQWNDLSGNNAHAVNAGPNRLPVYATNTLNGLPTVQFSSLYSNDSGDYLIFTRDGAIRTVFTIFKGESFLLTESPSNGAYNFHRPVDNDATSPLWASYVPDSIKRDGKTYVNSVLVDGTTYQMPTIANNGFNLVTVQSSASVIADSFNKDRIYHSGKQSHAEVLIYDRALTEAERVQVEGYLTSKWFPDNPLLQISTTLITQAGGTLDLNGHSQEVATLKGNGSVSNGTLVVANAIDLTNGVASAIAVQGNLTMKPGAALRVDHTASASDVVNVSGTLKLLGANTIRLNTLDGTLPPFKVTLFTFGTLEGAENLSSWSVELPPALQNYTTRFHSEGNQVSVSVFLKGTVLRLQ
jgi:autotransporter-associated beta strand protein